MPESLITGISIFVLAMFVGLELITKIPPTLHTPLMSGANAISGITLVGALIIAGPKDGGIVSILGLIAIVFATINVVVGLLGVWHYWWQVKKDASDAQIYAVILAVLLGLRIWWKLRQKKPG